MKTLDEIKSILASHQYQITRDFGVNRMGIFGSYCRGEQNENSDVDIIVQFNRKIGLLKFIELEYYLSGILGIKVDLVTQPALKPYIGQNILKEVVYL